MTENLNDQKLSYEKGPVDRPLLEKTIGDMLDEIVAQYPDNEALISLHQDLRYTYSEFQEDVNKCACALLAAGIRKGDRVGVWSPNYAQWALIQFATGKIGAILVNINPSYRLHELEYSLTHSGCSALLLAPHFKSSNYTAMIQELAPELAHCAPGMLVSAKLPNLKIVVRGKEETVPGMWTWDEFMSLSDSVSREAMREQQRRLSPHDPINIQYTSGTTGFPKGATLSHFNILNNGYFVGEIMKFTDQDRLVIPVPLYHCFGMVLGNLACVTHGATMIYPGDSFVAEKVLAAVEKEKATAIHGVPTMFIAKLEHEDFGKYDLTSLRTGLMAGSPCPIEVMKKVTTEMHLHEMEIAYGMTETSPVSTQTCHDAPLEKRVATVGRVHPHLEIKITSPETGETVPRGVKGEFCTRGYSVMIGYWNDEEQTREAIDEDGWMHTSDLAIMDDGGWINIVGRIKDMIIRGGENVYPREIEEFFYTNPKISDVQVIGVPDARYGEEIMAWIKLVEGESADAEELREYCKGQIAHYKIPRYIKLVDDFPMTVTGKIQKFVMRDQSIEELGLQDAAGVKNA